MRPDTTLGRRVAGALVLVGAVVLASPPATASTEPAAALTPLEQAAVRPDISQQLGCYGNGSDGARVHVIYGTVPGGVDRFDQLRDIGYFDFTTRVIDAVFSGSALANGGDRHVRFATTPGVECDLVVQRRTYRDASSDTVFAETRTHLGGVPGTRGLVLIDGESHDRCGMGDGFHSHSTAGPDNPNWTHSGVAIVWASCFFDPGYVAAHELLHTFGAVPDAASVSDGSGHCRTGPDIMCTEAVDRPCHHDARFLIDCTRSGYYDPGANPLDELHNIAHWNPFLETHPTAVSRDAPARCAAGPSPWVDTPEGELGRAMRCAAGLPLMAGYSDQRFHHEYTATREYAITAIANALRAGGVPVPSDAADAFDDDDGEAIEDDANALASLGVLRGTTDRHLDADDDVTRAQLASLVIRAGEAAGQTIERRYDYFADDSRNPHAGAINSAATAGLVAGTGDNRYQPLHNLTRGQLAIVASRMVDWLEDPVLSHLELPPGEFAERGGAGLVELTDVYVLRSTDGSDRIGLQILADSFGATGPSPRTIDLAVETTNGSVILDHAAGQTARVTANGRTCTVQTEADDRAITFWIDLAACPFELPTSPKIQVTAWDGNGSYARGNGR